MEGFRYLTKFYRFENQHLQIVLPETSHRRRSPKLSAPYQQNSSRFEKDHATACVDTMLNLSSALSLTRQQFTAWCGPTPPASWGIAEPFGAGCVCWWIISGTPLETHLWNYMQEVTGKFTTCGERLCSSRNRDPAASFASKNDDGTFLRSFLRTVPSRARGRSYYLRTCSYFWCGYGKAHQKLYKERTSWCITKQEEWGTDKGAMPRNARVA